MHTEDADRRIIEAFHTLWDTFPERVRLIRKDRTVLAVNKAAQALGMKTGVRCVDQPPVEGHIGCLANASLKDGAGKYGVTPNGARLRFWIPVSGRDDLYVHFSIPTNGLSASD